MDAPKILASTSGYGESIRTPVLVRPARRGDSFQPGSRSGSRTVRARRTPSSSRPVTMPSSRPAAGPTGARSARKI